MKSCKHLIQYQSIFLKKFLIDYNVSFISTKLKQFLIYIFNFYLNFI